uniref:Uncharacterized protein n=1 Tax=Panagrolaimus davidi TaxID=227884 RepID=A0A914PUD4_9BILA
MVIKYEVKLEALQKQLINTQNQLNAATIGLNNITKALAEDEYLTKLKFNLNEYVEKYLETFYEFMKILRSEKAVAIDKIPETFLKHFQGVKNEAFFYLRYAGCKGKNVMIEMTVAEGSPSQIFDCFSYTHVGVFKNDLFSRYKLKSMYCYENGKCSHIDSKKCLVYRDTLNCTESAFYKCDCEVNNVETCPVETKLAPPNFVHIEKCDDKIKIGGITVDGESENPTFIAQIYPDSFTVDPVPQVSQLPTMPVYEDKNVLENYSLEIIFFLSGLILILVVILCYVIIYCFKH